MAQKLFFIFSSGSFTIPNDCNTIDKLEIIAQGGNGSNGGNAFGGGGGGSGGYSASNVSLPVIPGATAWAQIPGTGSASTAWINIASNAAPATTTQGVLANPGGNASGSTAGIAGTTTGAVGTTTRAGAAGGAGATGTAANYTGGGGAGASGPNGVGNAGNAGTNGVSGPTAGGTGGSGDAGSGGAGGAAPAGGAGGTGGNGQEYTDASNNKAGAGGGGGGGGADASGNAFNGGTGGLYGSGGGGGAFTRTALLSSNGAAGTQALGIVTYTPRQPDAVTIGSRVPLSTLVDWIPPPPQPIVAKLLDPPITGPVISQPPFRGDQVSRSLWASWIPPPPQPPVTRPLVPPVSGPAPSQPPRVGAIAGLPKGVLNAWWPTPSGLTWEPIRARNLSPPISGNQVPSPASLFQLFNQIVAGQNTSWCDFDLYTISLFNGSVIRLTTADFDILANGNLFTAQGVRVDMSQSKTQAHWKVGLDVDTWTVVFIPRPTDPVTGATFPDTIGSVPWVQAAHSGYFDAADVQVDRAYFTSMPTWPMPPNGAVPLGTKTIFAGKVAEVDCTGLTVVMTLNDYRDLLSISMPRHFYQSQCRHALFDTGCNASGNMLRSSFAKNGVVQAGSTQNNIVTAGLGTPPGSGTYALGTIVMTSGQNNTFQRTIASWDGTNAKLVAALPFTVNAGDTFSIAPGCDLTQATCNKFGNIANFGGEPYIPVPETVAT